jgi:formylglycine-generating enzyme required for sulfatase activity
MKTLLIILVIASVVSARAEADPDRLVLIKGGTFKNVRSNYYGKPVGTASAYLGRSLTVRDFYIGRYEVTQKEWVEVMKDNPSKFKGDNFPVESVSWYDCVDYCNSRSAQEGLKPYYSIDKNRKDPDNENDIDTIKHVVTINEGANGYRLPTEMEWEYAADGGQMSNNFKFSGSNDVDNVAWWYKNSGDQELSGFWNWAVIEKNHNKTQPVGAKKPNELGLYDMAGNVREWCWNWYGESASTGNEPKGGKEGRVWRGGGWLGGDFCCASAWRASYEASGKGPDQGFRVCRNR